MRWTEANRANPQAVALADRHYSRQKPGSPQFVPPGSCFVLVTLDGKAVWTTSWPKAQWVKHAWAGAWMNSIFRNEAPELYLSSELILEAVSATRWFYGEPPALGMVTFIDRKKTRSKKDAGYCYLKAGFKKVGKTKGGLTALQLLPSEMPAPIPPLGSQMELGDVA